MGLNVTNYVLQMKGDKSIASGFDHATRTGDNTFSIYFIDGSKVDLTIPLPSDGQDGISITGVNDLGNGKFTLLLSDGSETDPIQTVKGQKGDKGDKLTFNDLTDEEKASLKGADGYTPVKGTDYFDGQDGFSPIIEENENNTDKIYKLDVTTANGTFTTPNLKGADGQGGTGGSGEENKIDSISVNGVNVVPDENKNVDITVPEAYDDTDIRTELANKSDTDHTHTTVNGHTVESDVPVDAKFTDTVYDDTQVKTQIQAVANGLMDSVGYSADYKTIDIIAKNGVKKSVNVAPIISHASITELSDVDTTNKATGKALVYNATTSKHEYADVSGTDEKVKMDASTDAKYLGELLDNITIANENGELKVKKLDGQEVTITEINYLKGLTMNVMDLVNMFSNGGVKIINTPVATYAELLTLDKSSFIEGISYLVYVLADENHDNAKTTYLVDKDSETPTYFGFADSQRDFTTNPIDLATEITGKLGIANMDSDAIKALFTVDDTYKTETTTNNAFSTHGAKELYDELILAIGNKANDSDLTAHKDDTNIHVSTEDRTKWDSAKTHADSVHAPSNAQENIIESLKINNQEITPDENKAVNIDLTGYAEHDEIVGENLIPFPYAQPERTTNGITFTFADDGSVIANGTATENADFSVCVRTNFGTDAALMLKPGIYAITGCPEGGSDSTYRIQVQFGDKTELKYSLKADYGKGFVFEVTEEYAQYACQIQCHVQKGYTVTDLVFKPMLVIGSVLKEYQPYKLSRESLRKDINAGVELASRVDNQFAIASGDYITVNDSVDGKLVELSVKGNSFQKTYGGKNLYNPTLKTNELNGITCTQNVDANGNPDGTYTINGTSTKDRWISFDYITLNPGKYKFIATENNVEVNNLCVSSKQTSIAIPGNIFTIQSKSVCDIGLSTMDKTFNNVLIKPMITTDLSATYDDFEPYVGGIPAPSPLYPQAINSVGDDGSLVVKSCGKNLIPFPYYNGSDTRNGITATVNNDDGSITLNGTATSNYFFVLLHRDYNGKGFARQFRGKTVTISGGTASPVLSFAVYDEDGNNVTPPNNEMLYDYGSGVTVTIPDNACDMYSYYYFSSGNTVDVTLRPQLEVSDVVTVYEPYKSSTATIPLSEPLRAIGDVKDEITYQDGKWGVLRRTGKYVVDGTESWVLDSDHIVDCGISVRLGGYTNILKGISSVTENTKDMITDYLRCIEYETIPYYATGNSVQEDKGSGTYRTSGNIWISFGASDIEKMGITKDVDSVKTWLSSHNITFIYPLGTPTFEPFTDQTLPYLSTYDGVTNISNDDVLSAEMTVKYPTTDASGVGSRNESRIAELAKDTDDKFDDVNESLEVVGKCKNLLKPTFNTDTHNGITFTRNDDGTYSLSGSRTDTSISAYTTFIDNLPLEKGKYKLTGALDENNYIRCIVKVLDSANINIYDYGNGVVLDVNETDTTITLLIVSTDDTSKTRIIKPMLTTDLNATYDDFVPYTGDGDTLTHDVAELKNDLGGLTFSASGTTLSITDGTNTWTLGANS